MSRRRRRVAAVTVGAGVLLAAAVAVPVFGWPARSGDAAQQPTAYTHPVPHPSTAAGHRGPWQHAAAAPRPAGRTSEVHNRSAPAVRTFACPRAADACVDVRAGRAWLQHRGEVTYGPVRISTGGKGHRTPPGTFHVMWKDRVHTSGEYGYPMPNSVFFAAGGIAFHQGPLGKPSHGCVHLSRRASRAFFAALHPGDRVVVR